MTAAPPLGITARAVVERIVDGDTLDITLEWPVRVRLLGCWAPEMHGLERDAGVMAKRALQDLLPHGQRVYVNVPTSDAKALSDVMTFGRVLADVWRVGEGVTVSELMVGSKFAKAHRTDK